MTTTTLPTADIIDAITRARVETVIALQAAGRLEFRYGCFPTVGAMLVEVCVDAGIRRPDAVYHLRQAGYPVD